MNIEIANRLVNLRKSNGLSQEALAEKLGISRQAVSKWERAEASPDTDNLIMLARLYRVSLDELLQTEDEVLPPVQEGCGGVAAIGGMGGVSASGNMGSAMAGGYVAGMAEDGHVVGSDMVSAVAGGCMVDSVVDGNVAEAVAGTGSGRVCTEADEGMVGTGDGVSMGDVGCSGNVAGAEMGKSGERLQGVRDNRKRDGDSGHVDGGGADREKKGMDGEDEYVHVGLGGIHVKDKDGSEVHVGWDGIHVEDRKKGDDVHIDTKGVYVNGKKYDRGWMAAYHRFPAALLVVILYLFLGFFFQAWHPAWMLFMLIPLWYSFLGAVERRNPHIFAYPVLAALLFLFMGTFFGAWHPGWVIFLTVPIYYPVVSFFWGKGDED